MYATFNSGATSSSRTLFRPSACRSRCCSHASLLPAASRPSCQTSRLHSGHPYNTQRGTSIKSKPVLRQHDMISSDGKIRAVATTAGNRSHLSTKDDVVGEYINALTEKVHDLAADVKAFVPVKADEVLSREQQCQIRDYIRRYVDLLMMEVDEEVKEFVGTLKDWPLDWLKQDGRVLLGLTGAPAGDYYGDPVVRFFVPGDRAGGNDELKPLPRHSLGPGDMVLLTSSKCGPLVHGGWDPDMMYGVVTERSKTWIKVAFEAGPDKYELDDCDTWRLDQSVNTLTTERALLALVALWHRIPFSNSTWSWPSITKSLSTVLSSFGSGSDTDTDNSDAANLTLKAEVDSLFEEWFDKHQHRRHMGVFEGSSLSDVVLMAGKEFDWSSLPAEAGGMTGAAISAARKALPRAGRPNEAETAALLRRMEQRGMLDSSNHGFRLDASQACAIATAILNPLTLLHGPPGTGKTTTIGGLLFGLRRSFGYKGKILAAAQSNVAVDNMLETAMRRGGLRVLRIGEPVKVRSCLHRFTLRVQLTNAMQNDSAIAEARQEQQRLRQKLRKARGKKDCDRLNGYERRMMYERLDELSDIIDKEVQRLTQELLAAADVVGVTCTGAAGPELAGAAFDMVVIDEGSQASEPEALIPLLKGCRRLVLVGDHKQLPPVVKSQEAAAGGLNVSLFERLMHLVAPSAMLQVQYRSHPALMSFVNQQFYNNLLSNGVAASDRPAPAGFPFPSPNVPIAFVVVEGREKSNARGSKLNEQEVEAVDRFVQHLVQRCGLLPSDIGIISPYAAQVSLITRRLQEQGYAINTRAGGSSDSDDDTPVNELEVKSVDGYQGREKEIILLSTVRANSQQQVGFLDDWRRANVALSRARSGLVVVGHRSTLRASDTWKAFIQHTAEQGCLVKIEHLIL